MILRHGRNNKVCSGQGKLITCECQTSALSAESKAATRNLCTVARGEAVKRLSLKGIFPFASRGRRQGEQKDLEETFMPQEWKKKGEKKPHSHLLFHLSR